ncbi:MAG: tetratricopeptide repeat protein [Pseudonocardiaceae bacterium]
MLVTVIRCAVSAFAVMLLVLTACASGPTPPGSDKPAPLFNDLGDFKHSITTTSMDAQRYFNQGLTLGFAFNHAEAERSLRHAARLDPQCAMCWWGVAFVLGPNINAPMDAAAATSAWEALEQAQAVATKASPREQAYIAALAKRYAKEQPADREILDTAFADAMRGVARQYPDDLDASALFAEALMDLTPWNYYDNDGKPLRPATTEIVTTLESVLGRDPKHAWAIHLYIHTTEASDNPARAESYADTLASLVPGAGHLVHMPGHTYMRIGRYHDAVLANERATAADNSYLSQCHAQGAYPVGYVPHNHHFLYSAASMEGNSAQALKGAAGTDAKTVHGKEHDPSSGTAMQHYATQPLFASVRFGKWQEILDTKAPPDGLDYRAGVWHYARGRAFVGTGKLDSAQAELAALRKIAAKDELKNGVIFINTAADVLNVAVEVLAGEIEARSGHAAQAVSRLERGVELEDAMRYNEPADWLYPVRHSLGAVLLAAGQAPKAEAVYREDLRRNPENGWALYGLMQALDAQGKKAESAEVKKRFDKAWAHADIALTASRI